MSQPIRVEGGHLVFPIDPKNTNLVEGFGCSTQFILHGVIRPGVAQCCAKVDALLEIAQLSSIHQ